MRRKRSEDERGTRERIRIGMEGEWDDDRVFEGMGKMRNVGGGEGSKKG